MFVVPARASSAATETLPPASGVTIVEIALRPAGTARSCPPNSIVPASAESTVIVAYTARTSSDGTPPRPTTPKDVASAPRADRPRAFEVSARVAGASSAMVAPGAVASESKVASTATRALTAAEAPSEMAPLRTGASTVAEASCPFATCNAGAPATVTSRSAAASKTLTRTRAALSPSTPGRAMVVSAGVDTEPLPMADSMTGTRGATS